jgi:predicted acylesterase/phospholipase RssA
VVRRALALAGGGPVAGLHIGALKAFEEEGIDFDVWALSCIGAWVGIVYNTRQGSNKAAQTEALFRNHVFRDDKTYKWFPINRAFAPNFGKLARAWSDFSIKAFDPSLYDGQAMYEAWESTCRRWREGRMFGEGALHQWWLNDVLAVHPASRFLTSLMFRSNINGLANIYYDDSPLLKELHIERLATCKKSIYHNAWNLDRGELQIFHNDPGVHNKHKHRDKHGKEKPPYRPITARSLCACSALPYVEETVWIPDDHGSGQGASFCEGALIDTVNFEDLVHDCMDADDHEGLDEVWVNRIVDSKQVRRPKDLHDGLANLCQMFAAEVGSNDVALFLWHLAERAGSKLDVPKVYEIGIDAVTPLTFDWSESNLDKGIDAGFRQTKAKIAEYRRRKGWSELPTTEPAAAASKSKVANGVNTGTRGRRTERSSPPKLVAVNRAKKRA